MGEERERGGQNVKVMWRIRKDGEKNEGEKIKKGRERGENV